MLISSERIEGADQSRYDAKHLSMRHFPLSLAVYMDPKTGELSPCIVHPYKEGEKAFITRFAANGGMHNAIEAHEHKGPSPARGHWWLPPKQNS